MSSNDALAQKVNLYPDYATNIDTSHQNHHHNHSHNQNSHCHAHNQNQAGSKIKPTHSLIIMMILTGFIFLIEIIVGNATHSNTLVADSFHMLSDVISFVIALVAIRVAKNETNSRNTFGWARAEVLGSLINSVFLVALCFSIVVEALNRFFEPHPLKRIDYILAVGAIGLIINLFGMVMLSFVGKS